VTAKGFGLARTRKLASLWVGRGLIVKLCSLHRASVASAAEGTCCGATVASVARALGRHQRVASAASGFCSERRSSRFGDTDGERSQFPLRRAMARQSLRRQAGRGGNCVSLGYFGVRYPCAAVTWRFGASALDWSITQSRELFLIDFGRSRAPAKRVGFGLRGW
jgi:hypothetical protein